MSITGRADGEDGRRPAEGRRRADRHLDRPVCDDRRSWPRSPHRDRTGEGQHIDLALLDVQIACLANQAPNYLTGGVVPRRMGNAHPNIVPYQDFPTADGDMILAVGNDGQFAKFCAGGGPRRVGRATQRFATNPQRVEHRAALIPLLRQATRDAHARTSGSPRSKRPACRAGRSIASTRSSPTRRCRRARPAHRAAACRAPAAVPLVANPIRLSESPVAYRHAPPLLGEHTDEALGEWLGLDAAALEALRRAAVI